MSAVAKVCNRCGVKKPHSEFYKDRSKPDGLSTRCKPCVYRPSDSDWEAKKKLRQLALECGKNICSACGELKDLDEFYAGEHRCKSCCVKRASDYNRRTRTGWTEEEYEEAYLRQDGKCAICRKPQERKALAADHCHVTSTKRGLLCSECNLILGKANDDPNLLRRAADYLEETLNA